MTENNREKGIRANCHQTHQEMMIDDNICLNSIIIAFAASSYARAAQRHHPLKLSAS